MGAGTARLLGRDDGGAVGVLDPLDHLFALENLDEGLELSAVVALADSDDVREGDVGAFHGDGGTHDVGAGLERVVGVDHGEVNVGQHARHGGSFELLDLQVLGVLGDVEDGRGLTGGHIQLTKLAAGSTNVDGVGTAKTIENFSGGTFTVPEGMGAAANGDQFAIYPPIGFAKGNLTETGLSLAETDALSLKVVGHDLGTKQIFLMAKKHVLGQGE